MYGNDDLQKASRNFTTEESDNTLFGGVTPANAYILPDTGEHHWTSNVSLQLRRFLKK